MKAPKKNIILRAVLAMSLAFSALQARADGEQIEGGSTWVDPVEFFKLQDIDYTDCRRDYDQGDIDFNNVLLKSGVKVYGLRLKPLCIAGHIEKFYSFGEWNGSRTVLNELDYHDMFGVKGAPLSEAGFCIYADEGVSRSYSGYYNFSTTEHLNLPYCKDVVTDKKKVTVSMNIKNLRMIPSTEGIAFDYTADAKMVYTGTATRIDGETGKVSTSPQTNSDEPQRTTKKPGENPLLCHFIYYKGGSRLFLIVGVDYLDVWNKYKKWYTNKDGDGVHYRPASDEEKKGFLHPWGRVYFEVEEVMIDSEDAKNLTQEDKEELLDFAEGIDMWLRGEGDPYGLGEHTDAKESIAIQVMSTIAAILLGGGVGGFIGGTGSQIVANLTEIINGGGGGADFPPELPEREGLEGKKPEEEEEKDGDTPPTPPDDKLFHPTDYPELCNQYIKEGPDGTLTVKDPATGKKTEYYPTEDGKWVKYYGDTNPLTDADIEDRVRFSYENSDYVNQNAETAKRNQEAQRKLWDDQNKRDLERGYSNEMQAYRDWKAEQEQKQKHEEYIEKLADKYHTTIDKLEKTIKKNQIEAKIEGAKWLGEEAKYDNYIAHAELVDKLSEVTVNVMGECVPGGRVIKNAYTFAKSTLVAASEAHYSNMSAGEKIAHIMSGAGQGALGVIQNQAGDLTKNPLKEYAITVGTEMVKDGMKIYEKTGDLSKTMYGMINSGGKKTGDFVLGKLVSGGLNKLKTGAEQSLKNGPINIKDDVGIRMKPENAEKVLNFFKPKGGYLSTGLKGWQVEIKGANSSTFNADMNNWTLKDLSKNFSIKGTSNVKIGGTVDLSKMLSTKSTEAASKFGLHDWEGQTTEGLTRDAVNLKTDLSNFKQALVKRAQEYGRNHPRK